MQYICCALHYSNLIYFLFLSNFHVILIVQLYQNIFFYQNQIEFITSISNHEAP